MVIISRKSSASLTHGHGHGHDKSCYDLKMKKVFQKFLLHVWAWSKYNRVWLVILSRYYLSLQHK